MLGKLRERLFLHDKHLQTESIETYSINVVDNSPSPFDQDDKEVAESMSCTTNYPIQFEACEYLNCRGFENDFCL